jgi:3-oxoacyl-[acyl-carrier protein] reductase
VIEQKQREHDAQSLRRHSDIEGYIAQFELETLATLSKSMAVELAPDRIRVNCVAPVIGDTALLEAFMGAKDTPENHARFVATIPLGRLATPADIANACVYLGGEESIFITGAILPVDGGRTI